MEDDESSSSTSSSEDGSEFNPYQFDIREYSRSETSDWMAKEVVDYWRSLTEREKEEMLSIYNCDLVHFSRMVMHQPWLGNFLQDAVAFFQLHGTWKMYVCPDLACSRLFKDDESLINHLKRDHFSEAYPVARPPTCNNLAKEQRFANALRKMVWKPIVVDAALDLLSTMCLDYNHVTMADVCAASDRLETLNWKFSDNLERKMLLDDLGEAFRDLLAKQEKAPFSLIYDGLFTRMTALASKLIFIDCPRYNVSFLQCLLAHSPLSFCLLKERHLSRFVVFIRTMCQLYSQDASCSANQELNSGGVDFSWSNSEILETLSASLGDVSVKKVPLSCTGWESLLLSLCRASAIPSIQIIPDKAAAVFTRVQDIQNCMIQRPTDRRLTHMIKSACAPCNIPGDFVSLKVVEYFNPGSKRHLWMEPFCCYEDPEELQFTESFFERELFSIRIGHELQYLVSQLRQLCAVNCQMFISLLIGSLLRLKLYICMRCLELGLEEGFPILAGIIVGCCFTELFFSVMQRRTLYQEENTESEVSSDGSESECDSDYEANESSSIVDSGGAGSGEDSNCEDNLNSERESKRDQEIYSKPWRANPALRRLDSTLRKCLTAGNESTGPFFWMVISDVWKHCLKHRYTAGYDSVFDGIRRFKLNKTWKYWLCYICCETFTDPESHMVHLVGKHQLCLAHEDCWLIPKQYSRNAVDESRQDAVDELRQDVVKRDPALEDSITLDHTHCYFLVDSTKLDQMPSAHEEEELGQAKHKKYMEIIHGLHSEYCSLRCIFHTKREYLTYLEVVNALGHVLFSGGQSHIILVTWLRKLSTMDRIAGSTHQWQFKFLSALFYQTYHPHYCPSSNDVQKVYGSMRDDLIRKIDCQDEKIVEALVRLVRIDAMKHNLSEFSVCDYRTKIMPCIKSFLHSKFRFDDGVISLGCNNIRKLLSSIDRLLGVEDSFGVVVKSPGKVIINTRKNKSSWAIAFIGINLNFVGEWSLTGSAGRVYRKVTGGFKFGARLSWGEGVCRYKRFSRVIPDDEASYLSMESTCHFMLEIVFSHVVFDTLFKPCVQYVKQNSGDSGR